jgi:hypothetical protein
MKYQIIRYWGTCKGFGKVFDTREEAEYFLNNDNKVFQDEEDGFTFGIAEVEE